MPGRDDHEPDLQREPHAGFDGFRGELFLNVRNLANTDPPSTPNPGTDYSIRVSSGVYDVLGRVYRGGLRFRL